MLRERLKTAGQLLREGARGENRQHFVLLVVIVMAGLIVALGAMYPLVAPFLYTLF